MAAQPKANRGPSAGPENRRAIIDAARLVFAESGFNAPLSAVAKRAEVGQGSLYRHFPDRVGLAVAVFTDNIGELEARADHPDATLSDLFDGIADQAIGSTALIDLISSESHDPRVFPLAARITALTERMLARDQSVGRIHSDVTAEDIVLSFSMMAFALARTDEGDRAEVANRARAIFRRAFSL